MKKHHMMSLITRMRTRLTLIVLALVLSVLCVLMAEIIAYRVFKDRYPFTYQVFSDGSEVYGLHACEISDGIMTVTGSDPHFLVSSYGQAFSRIRLEFREALEQDTEVQIYYAPVDGSFSEKYSTKRTIEAGKKRELIYIPRAAYEDLRFDIEQNVSFEGIYIGDQEWTVVPYGLRKLRISIILCIVFIPLCILILYKTRTLGELNDKDRNGDIGGIKRKLNGVVLLCNLFLSMTVFAFQPLDNLQINSHFARITFKDIWWMQLLLGAGIALVLSVLIHILPEKGRKIAASVSLGFGVAFLVQSLLLNDGRTLPMNMNWPIELLDVHVWFGIVIIIVVMGISYSNQQEKKAEITKCVIAWVLIIMQAVNLTAMATAVDLSANSKAQIERTDRENLISTEKQMLSISMERGLPYLLKDNSIYIE